MSKVWEYFNKHSLGGKCKICFKIIKTKNNATNLRNHIVKIHKVNLSSLTNTDEDVEKRNKCLCRYLYIININELIT